METKDITRAVGKNEGEIMENKLELAYKEVFKNSKIVIPDFDKSKPIGYKDLSHINNTYGDRVAQSNNQNNK